MAPSWGDLVGLALRAVMVVRRLIGRWGMALFACVAAIMAITAVAADEEYDVTPNENGITLPSIATSLPNNGDANGVRKWLNDHGIAYAFIYTNDALSNVSGGNRRGAIDQ